MAPTVVLVLPEPPSSNRYWRRHGKIIHVSAEARAYCHAVAMLTQQYRVNGHCAFPSGDLSVVVIWHRSAKRGDLPNRTKVLYDALQGSLYADDKQIAHEETWRVDESATIPKGMMWVEVSLLTDALAVRAATAPASTASTANPTRGSRPKWPPNPATPRAPGPAANPVPPAGRPKTPR